ncbi:MAG: hypothetical protein Kow0029_05200 [Candidatus Rifleibacteriota bacterium]
MEKPGNAPETEIRLDDIWASADYELDDVTRNRVYAYMVSFMNHGFMPFYRKVYFKLYAKETVDFTEKFAAASALLLVSHNLVKEKACMISGKRLFLHFCRNFMIDDKFTVRFSQLNKKFGIFTGVGQLEDLWKGYIREVWARKIRPEAEKSHKIKDNMLSFLKEFPDLEKELKTLISPIQQKEEKYDFFLIDGKSGRDESDYELRRVD